MVLDLIRLPIQALSIEPLNAHILELLNMSLEAASYPAANDLAMQLKTVTAQLNEKFKRHGLAPVMKESADVPTDVAPNEGELMMNFG